VEQDGAPTPDRAPARRSRWAELPSTWRVLVPLTALAAGLLFATSASTAQGTDLRSDRRLQLQELIARERGDVQARERRVAELRSTVDAISARAAADDQRVAQAAAPSELELAAGLVPVTGPALTVSLDDAPRRAGRPELSDDPDDLVVHQQDLQAVVNALWSGGAEAMTLMGQRIVSTSAVRCVGNTVILHGRVYGPPFVITAIGDPAAMRDALDDDPGVLLFRSYVDRFGLGYTVRTQRPVTLPAYDGPLALPHVRPQPRP
jgi:uncharacterized protein YlxW (UPF0749 family)